MSKRYPGGIIRKTPQTPSQTSAQGIWDMASVTQAVKENTWPIAGVPDPISRSLRFRSSASASLSRTPASASNRTTWTWSGWVKRAEITTTERTFFSAGTDGNNFTALAWINDSLYFQNYTSGTQTITNTTAVFRDPSAWYHIVLAIDTTQGTAANRAKIYVNGVQQAGFSGSPFSSSQQFWINFTYTHRIGSRQLSSADSFSEQYLTEVYFIDGQALTPSSFGNTNDQTGVWQPIAYTGTYGTNGFYLPFSNTASTSTLGNDFSGNSNNWTTNNISLTTGTSIQTFSTTGTTSWTAPGGVTSVSYLVVAGGGSGGAGNGGGGGGGAGGLLTGTLSVTPGNSYTVTVGAGGTGTGSAPYRNSGGNSVFGSITATGGGGGGYDGTYPPLTGGSGGGGNYSSTAGAAGTSGQGFAGGSNTASSGAYGGGGGGGSSADGAVGTSSVGGTGGAGTASSISGSSVTYAGGGGGGVNDTSTVGSGAAGGGNGGANSGVGGNATANTGSGGGGGGGGSVAGGNGGSGIVILSWTNSASTYDSMTDVPTQWIPYNTAGDTGGLFRGNYCVINPLSIGSSVTIANGNLTFTNSASDHRMIIGSMAVSSGKWYAEFTATSLGNTYPQIGIVDITQWSADSQPGAKSRGWGYLSDGRIFNNNSLIDTGEATYTTGDVIGVAIDLTNNKVYFSKNGTFINSADPAAGTNGYSITSGYDYAFSMSSYDFGTDPVYNLNFGQRPFSYTPPSGFKTLNTTNLPTPTIGATASTTANKYFDATLYTGNGTVLGSTQTITNAGSFQPDFVWLKSRSNAEQHNLYDVVRGISSGGSPTLFTDAQTQETTYSGYGVSALNSNGFTVIGNGGLSNNNGFTYVGWQWRASNATAVTNTSGSISSQVSANTTAGFSIVTYTGNGSNATIGHGLGVAPSMIIRKARNASLQSNWYVYHQSSSANGALFLNLTDAYFASANYWNNTAPTSTVFSVGSATNVLNDTWVAYCFTPVAGYSAFGSYVGNASTDGPFVFTGFRPRYVMVKDVSADTPPGSSQWRIWDTSRAPYNAMDNTLQANASNAEQTGVGMLIDSLSNGFKLRDTNIAVNRSGDTFIYMAFAEFPFKFSLAR